MPQRDWRSELVKYQSPTPWSSRVPLRELCNALHGFIVSRPKALAATWLSSPFSGAPSPRAQGDAGLAMLAVFTASPPRRSRTPSCAAPPPGWLDSTAVRGIHLTLPMAAGSDAFWSLSKLRVTAEKPPEPKIRDPAQRSTAQHSVFIFPLYLSKLEQSSIRRE